MADLAAIDLRSPDGEIEDWLFPDESSDKLNERLDRYLVEGYEKADDDDVTGTDRDDAAREWAYYRAYRQAWIRLASSPMRMSLRDVGSADYTQTQLDEIWKLAQSHLDEFHLIVPVGEATGTTNEVLPPSGHVNVVTNF